ncbi:hypothetical protein [Streptomyces sp. NPDC060001]|uniref:hypothetical protein n=1 Tax=Streptomyces sp. NPDC060001 TaxID=3347032 RepID=UPI0036C6C3D1
MSGAVRLEMKPASTYSYEVDKNGGRRLIVSRDEYEELAEQIRDGDGVRAELKRSLDDALSAIERLSDERDTWQSAAHSHAADLARMVDENKRLKEERDALRSLQSLEPAKFTAHLGERTWTDGLFVLPDQPKRDWKDTDLATHEELADIAATAPVGSLVDDLKNTIVSQAREIARLKGHGE